MKHFLLLLSVLLMLNVSVNAQDDTTYQKFRFGGYGEMLASWKNYGLNRWSGSTN